MKILITFFFNILAYLLFSQNIVLNSGFEEYTKCPTDNVEKAYYGYGVGVYEIFNLQYVKHWEISKKFPSDYNNIDCNRDFSNIGYLKPHIGKGCAIIYASTMVVGELSSKLIKDSLYEISAFVRLFPKSNGYADYLQVYLEAKSDSNFTGKNCCEDSKDIFKWYKPEILIYNDSLKIKSWIKVSALYKAKGGEDLISIGEWGYINKNNSHVEQITPFENFNMNKDFLLAGYYIDDISVVPFHSTYKISRPFAVYDINFDLNSSTIQSSSFPYLKKLADYLNAETEIKVEISGHTDNTGSDEINKPLSLARAESVKKYLISKGIKPDRIKTFGIGSTKPIISNDTEEGRAKNRRIEFKLLM